jgi:hypothetical protein
MKLKALQEKERMVALDNRMKRGNETRDLDQDADEKIMNAKRINQIILNKSKDSSLVVTNLPPILEGQNA